MNLAHYIFLGRILGTPTDETWPGVTKLPDYKPIFPKWGKMDNGGLKKAVPTLCTTGLSLLEVRLENKKITELCNKNLQYLNWSLQKNNPEFNFFLFSCRISLYMNQANE